MLSSRFIVRLYGTYQTYNELVLVTELLLRGDLWSVIYETEQYSNGMTLTLAQFYIASIISALSHVHEHDIAYRDIKVCVYCNSYTVRIYCMCTHIQVYSMPCTILHIL